MKKKIQFTAFPSPFETFPVASELPTVHPLNLPAGLLYSLLCKAPYLREAWLVVGGEPGGESHSEL